jgi:hypothetical protein
MPYQHSEGKWQHADGKEQKSYSAVKHPRHLEVWGSSKSMLEIVFRIPIIESAFKKDIISKPQLACSCSPFLT